MVIWNLRFIRMVIWNLRFIVSVKTNSNEAAWKLSIPKSNQNNDKKTQKKTPQKNRPSWIKTHENNQLHITE